jgi:hypothetical protein
LADANNNNTSIIDSVASPTGDATLGTTLDYNSSLSEVENEDNIVGQAIDFEVVGLDLNGRFCCCHKTCRKEAAVGDLLCLARTVVDIDGRTEAAITLVRIIKVTDDCAVGLVPRVQSKLPKVVEC